MGKESQENLKSLLCNEGLIKKSSEFDAKPYNSLYNLMKSPYTNLMKSPYTL